MIPKRTAWLALAAFCIGVWAIQLPALFRAQMPYSPDSASYIECARSIRSGKGFLVRQERGLDPVLWQPIQLWPPGFPLLIAAAQSLSGTSALNAGIFVSLICVALFLLVFAWISLKLLPPLLACAAAVLTGLMHAILLISIMCWSEGAYLFVSAASAACLLLWMKQAKRLSWLFLAGLLAGAAYSIRNVAVALIAATVCFLLWDSRRTSKVLIRNLLVWAGGLILTAGPVVARSLLVFGRLNPYTMPASELTLQQNLQRTVWVILRDLTTWHTAADFLSRWLTQLFFLAAVAAVLFALLFFAFRKYSLKPSRSPDFQHRALLFLKGYVLFYLVALVISRTNYYWWGELIASRHLIQIYWILIILSVRAALSLARRLPVKEKTAQRTIAIFLLLATVLQVRFHQVELREVSEDAFHRPIDGSVMARLNETVPKDKIVLACRAYQLRIFSDLAARQLPRVYRGEKPLSLEEIQAAGSAKIVWGIVIDDPQGAQMGKYGSAIQKIIHAQRRGASPWRRLLSDSQVMVLKYVPLDS